jgi:membrane-bound ClpP family serine protease
MNRGTIAALVTGSALVGAGYILSRRQRPQALPSNVIPIITPVIDLSIAEDVLEAMEQISGDEVTLVLHTLGGCVTSCVLIANALREFPASTAIVPYMAISGGTLIALNASRLQMGKSASLSAVDPIVRGQRARHVGKEQEEDPGIHALAKEYETAIGRYLRETLAARLPGADKPTLDHAMSVFMGEHAPARVADPAARGGTPGSRGRPAARSWGVMVDTYRKRWW